MAVSPLDLTTLALAKAWIPQATSSATDDTIIQACITAWGYAFLSRTGLGDQNGDYQQSPFVQLCNFNETYDGTGTTKLPLRNRPIVNVSVLMINGVQIVQSTGYPAQGWVIAGNAKFLVLRGGYLGFGNQLWTSWQAGPYRAFAGGLRFWEGPQNVNVQYTAGYANTPGDIQECANEVVAQNYRRRNWVDEAQRAAPGGGGSTRYRDWIIPPWCQEVVDRYTRTL